MADYKAEQMVREIERRGVVSRGVNCLKKFLKGGRLTQREAILAKCADCMGYYIDGRIDCQIPECPLYPFMPYRPKSTG